MKKLLAMLSLALIVAGCADQKEADAQCDVCHTTRSVTRTRQVVQSMPMRTSTPQVFQVAATTMMTITKPVTRMVEVEKQVTVMRPVLETITVQEPVTTYESEVIEVPTYSCVDCYTVPVATMRVRPLRAFNWGCALEAAQAGIETYRNCAANLSGFGDTWFSKRRAIRAFRRGLRKS